VLGVQIRLRVLWSCGLSVLISDQRGSVTRNMQSSVSPLSGVLFNRPQTPCPSLPDIYTAPPPLSNCLPTTRILPRYATSWTPKLDLSVHQSSWYYNLGRGRGRLSVILDSLFRGLFKPPIYFMFRRSCVRI
jgi:hypothetical protein